MLGADESTKVGLARTDYDTHDLQVRGVIYDAVLHGEGDASTLDTQHGLVGKPMHRWQDNFFMSLRHRATRTGTPVQNVLGKKICV